MFNTEQLHGIPISVNLATNAILKTILNDSYSITTRHTPFKFVCSQISLSGISFFEISSAWIVLIPFSKKIKWKQLINYQFHFRHVFPKQYFHFLPICWSLDKFFKNSDYCRGSIWFILVIEHNFRLFIIISAVFFIFWVDVSDKLL